MKTKVNKEMLEAMRKNSNNWRGILYFNYRDPGVIVPKLYPMMGWTLNFANPYSYIALLALIALIVSTQYIL